MKTLIQTLFHRIALRWREHWHLSLALIALRHQVEVLKRSVKRLQFSSSDRGLWILVSTWWSEFSRTPVAKYMDRRPGPPSPTWCTFWRIHALDLHVHEVYAELSDRLRAISTRVLRIIPTLYYWLWAVVSGWWRWSLRRHMSPATESTIPHMAPGVRPLSKAESVRAFGQNPPHCRSSSIDPPSPLYPPIEMGRADVRLMSSVTNECVMPPNTALTAQDVSNVPGTDRSQQAAA